MGNITEIKDVQVQATELDSPTPSQEKSENQFPPSLPTPAWPQAPRPPVPQGHERLVLILFDVVLIAIPLLLILKIAAVIVCWHIDINHINSNVDQVHPATRILVQFNEQLVTLFTIVFVTIVSTLVKRYALYKAQKGAYLSDLEQLQGSVSMTSTLKLVWSLRSWSKQSLILCFIWCFYYLGSQASKREFALADSGQAWFLKGASRNFTSASFFLPIDPTPGVLSNPNYLNQQFSRLSLIAFYKDPNADFNRGADPDGWPLLPNMDFAQHPDPDVAYGLVDAPSMDNVKARTADRHGWVDVSKQSGNLYTSLVGGSVYTYDSKSNTSYTDRLIGTYSYKTGYLTISCGVPEGHKFTEFPSTMPNGTRLAASMNMIMRNVSSNAAKDNWGHPLREFDLWMRWDNGTIFDGNSSTLGPGAARATCNITATHVEMDVNCASGGCFPRRMRYRDPSQLNSPSVLKYNTAIPARNATSYSTSFDDPVFAANFFTNITLSTGPATDLSGQTQIYQDLNLGGIPAAMYYVYDPNTSYACANCGDPAFTMRNSVSPSMSYFFNTYHQLGQTLGDNYAEVDVLAVQALGTDGQINPILIKGAYYKRAYYIYWQWIAMDFVSCLVLLTAGVMCYWLRIHTIAPDIFGYVSSLTRDNPNVDLPDNGTTLAGLERARLMKHIKVKIGDLNGQEETQVGKIGLASIGNGNKQVVGLTKQKMYM